MFELYVRLHFFLLIFLSDAAKLENNPKVNFIKINWPKGGGGKSLRKKEEKPTIPYGN